MVGSGGNGERLPKGYKLLVTTQVGSEDLIYNMVTIFDNSVLYNWNLVRVKLNSSHQKKKANTWGDICVNEHDCGNFLTVYMSIKWSCTFNVSQLCLLYPQKAKRKLLLLIEGIFLPAGESSHKCGKKESPLPGPALWCVFSNLNFRKYPRGH